MNRLVAWELVLFGMTSSAWAQAMVWPPSDLLRVGVTVRLERRRVPVGEYYLIFGARDSAGNIRSGNAPVQIR